MAPMESRRYTAPTHVQTTRPQHRSTHRKVPKHTGPTTSLEGAHHTTVLRSAREGRRGTKNVRAAGRPRDALEPQGSARRRAGRTTTRIPTRNTTELDGTVMGCRDVCNKMLYGMSSDTGHDNGEGIGITTGGVNGESGTGTTSTRVDGHSGGDGSQSL